MSVFEQNLYSPQNEVLHIFVSKTYEKYTFTLINKFYPTVLKVSMVSYHGKYIMQS